jgi:nicotinamidase-related amidase
MQLSELIEPSTTAVLVSEMQRGIVGDLVTPAMSILADAVEADGMVARLATLLDGARSAGTRVVHTTLQYRPGRAGVNIVSPLMAVTMRNPDYLLADTPDAEIVADLALRGNDLNHARLHGMSAFTGTDLDVLLRGMGIKTLVMTGVSLNEAIMGAAIAAVDLGYRIVIVRDAAMGLPLEFKEQLLTHAYKLLGKVTTVDEIVAVWADL